MASREQDPVAFRVYIQDLLRLSGLKESYIERMTDREGMETFRDVFTHASVDKQRNYEWFEIMGDSTLNKCIVWYVSRRFPILQNAEGVKVIARLKINMVSKKKFSEIAQSIGMDRFVRYDVNELPAYNSIALHSMMEDVFEAFFGATEWLVDKLVEPGAGYGICYAIIAKILDRTEISLDYNDLYDAVTRLKETFDICKTRLPGTIRYENRREDHTQFVTVLHVGPNGTSVLGRGQAHTLDEAKQIAAGKAILLLEKRGISKPIPPYYLKIREWLRQNHHPPTRR